MISNSCLLVRNVSLSNDIRSSSNTLLNRTSYGGAWLDIGGEKEETEEYYKCIAVPGQLDPGYQIWLCMESRKPCSGDMLIAQAEA